MKRLAVGLIIFSLFMIGSVACAQGPEMMDSGLMGGPSMMESEQSKGMKNQNTSAGAEIFNAHCRVCHVAGGNIISPSKPLKGSTKLANFETFLSFIRNPKLPDGSRGAMPSFSKSQISDKQAEELYQFVTSSEHGLMGGGPDRRFCPRYAQCAGSQKRYPIGCGMMMGGHGMRGRAQQGWNYCPYCGHYLGQGNYGMMGSGYYGHCEACQDFMNDAVEQRKE